MNLQWLAEGFPYRNHLTNGYHYFFKNFFICLHQILVAACMVFQSVSQSVQSLSRVWLFATPWIAARQASLSITISQSSLRLSQWCHPTISSSVIPFSSGVQTLSCGIWDLAPWPGPLLLRVRNLSHWTSKEVPITILSVVAYAYCQLLPVHLRPSEIPWWG